MKKKEGMYVTQVVLVTVISLIMVFSAPACLLHTSSAEQEKPLVLHVQEAAAEINPQVQLMLKTEHGVQKMLLEDYLVGVLFAEMPVTFHEEALKAQAVAARTYTMHQLVAHKHDDCDLCADHNCCQAWCSMEEIQDKLGDSFSRYWKKLNEAVHETAGEVITYDEELIEAVYFSCSGGKTEAAVSVWGSDVPYLQAVDSAGEENAPKFETEKRISLEEFSEKICANADFEQLVGTPSSWFGDVEYSSGGGVQQMQIGGQWFSGTKLRSIFELNSTLFQIVIEGREIVFQVAGYGHRVGLSQYGANAMAEEGADYRQILEHYYTGVMLEKTTKRSNR